MSANIRKPIMVIGLGRFGGAVSRTLERMGHEVLAVDTDPALVQHFAGDLTKVVEADATETTTLERLGAKDFDAAVAAIHLPRISAADDAGDAAEGGEEGEAS